MCGIAGTLRVDDDRAVTRMTTAMAHRGPDDVGYFHDDELRLGFRRLSIIDLAHGHQPMSNETGELWLVCNGEIYNHADLRSELSRRGHRFRTASDAEVIVHLYEEAGVGCLERLEGMFAFALWDRRSRSLLLARDPLGIKPLFYAPVGRAFVFASELKAILATGLVPREVSHASVVELMRTQAIAAPATIVRAISALKPGHYLWIDPAGDLGQCGYWSLTVDPDVERYDDHACEALVRSTFAQSVRRHLQSDVPVGVFLSGGVDSTALVAATRGEHAGPLPTYTVGFDDRDPGAHSELAEARLTAQHFSTDHHELVVSAADCAAELDRFVLAMDQPSVDGVNSFFVAKVAARQVKVALSGIGSDELFLGYPRDWGLIAAEEASAPMRSTSPRRVAAARWLIDALPERFLSPPLRRRVMDLRHPMTLPERFFDQGGIGLFTDAAVREMWAGVGDGCMPWAAPASSLPGAPREPLSAAMSRLELFRYASPVLLRDMDAMSMFHSLEVRVPFLDQRFLRLAFSLPMRLKVLGGDGKVVLKRALRRLLPTSVLQRPKAGFSLPLAAWMRADLRPAIHDMLCSGLVRRHRLCRPESVSELLRRFESGEQRLYYRIWLLFVLHAWCDRLLEGRSVV